MRDVLDHLARQHKDLVKAAGRLGRLLDPARLPERARDAHQALLELSGALQVHLAMEDRSFYPNLLAHRDQALRAEAKRFLDTRGDLQTRFDSYRRRWTAVAIAAQPAEFAADTAAMLQALGERMFEEERELHPTILARVDDAS